MAAKTLEISTVIDEGKVGSYQKLIIALCAAVVFLDGFDAQAIGYVAPALIGAHVLTPPQLGPLFSVGLVGLMLGALFVAPLADRIGRRPVILVSTLLFGLFSLATAWATNADQFMVLRFLTGLGLGGCMPNAIALTSEYAPTRSRSLLVMIMFNGFTLGSLIGGLVSAQMVPTYGWPWVFLVGGALPLLLLPVLFFTLPESLRFLVLAKGPPEKIARLVRRLDPGVDADAGTQYVVAETSKARMSVRRLLSDGRAKRTLLLWIVFFMSLLDVYMLVNWLPTMMRTVGAPIRTAILIGVALQLGGLLGAPPLGYILDRVGARRTMGPAYMLAAVSIALIGVFASTSIPLTMLVVFMAGFGVIGGQTAANAVAATSYPTEIRSTGVGWALGVGRVGSIVGPLLAGVLTTMHVAPRDIFFLTAVPALVAAVACFGLGGGKGATKAAVVAH
ncbi:MAG TPA: MFS transporter [Caulobacteraceae bacterium]|nr:MFS transporter [Caulobacteraceae bacterium]